MTNFDYKPLTQQGSPVESEEQVHPHRRALMAGLLSAPWWLAASPVQAQATRAELDDLQRRARAEGRLASLGMPAEWANWGATWADLGRLYGIKHVDTDMSSAEELAKMAAEGRNATADMGDVGFEFGEIARTRGLTAAFKPSTWADIPAWAKDTEGHWMLSYTGTIALCTHTRLAKQASGTPMTWREALSGRYRVCVGEVGRAAQANAAVLAAAVAMGGSEKNLKPAIEAFTRLQADGKLLTVNPSVSLMERSEADVYLLWDFNGLNFRAKAGANTHEVLIPEDGSVTSGYTTIINKHAPHPAAARLAREYILSDAGQENLARGRARPIRVDRLNLPKDVTAGLIPQAQYRAARPIRVQEWTDAAKGLASTWQAAMAGARK